jgi:xanthine dehydrogenase accessory factor
VLTEVWPFIARATAAGIPVVLARLVGRDGPGSRPLGATMAVAADGTWRGSLSGGCVEGIVLDEARGALERGVLEGGGSRLISVSPGDHLMPWEEAPACGGVLHVLLTPVPAEPEFSAISAALEAARPIAVGVELAAPWSWRTAPSLPELMAALGSTTSGSTTSGSTTSGSATLGSAMLNSAMLGSATLDSATLGSATLDSATLGSAMSGSAALDPAGAADSATAGSGLPEPAGAGPGFAGLTLDGGAFVEEVRPGPRLIVVGATDLATALAALGRTVGRRVEVVDPRPSHAQPEMFPGASVVSRSWPDAWLAAHPPSAADAVLAIAHDPRIDDRALQSALPGPAGYVGVLGSRPTHERRLARLAGTPGLDRLSGPAGLDLGGSSVAETALSILAEVVASTHARSGGRLSEVSSPIRAAAPASTAPPVGPRISGGEEVPLACAL